ncbi:MAG: hypothetical protein JST00_08310 [Deltaproteobacteria bacterium]|nr:hypothetical protein [Deltaproteobacteria bacterium]
MSMKKLLGLLTVFPLGFAAYACSSDDTVTPQPTPTEAGADTGTGTDGGVTPKSGGFQITVSGEDLAVNGYAFGPDAKAEGDPPAFVDGWEVKFEHVIVTIGNVRLNADPEKDEANPENVGAAVAKLDGTFAVDATIGGPIVGKSGSPDEKTVALGAINAQSDGKAFDPTARYAFSYDIVAASAAAKDVNLDAEGKALYEEAKTKGWATIYVGTATFKGPAPAAGSVFEKMPKQVKFKLGFKNPASYVNCSNTDLQQLPSGEFPRGLQASADKVTTAQITIHTDHAFWNKLNVEGTPLHFDPIAARASTYGNADAGAGTVTIEDLASVDITGFQTKANEPLPRRSLVPDYTAPAGQLAFDANGTTFAAANSFASYLGYSAMSGGHMNADGECVVKPSFTP